MKNIHIIIDGMSCGHCVMVVKKELQKLESVIINDVKIGSANISIDETKLSNDVIKNAISEAGYSVQSIQ